MKHLILLIIPIPFFVNYNKLDRGSSINHSTLCQYIEYDINNSTALNGYRQE